MDKDMNEKPHLLHAKVAQRGHFSGITWSVECPYEAADIRTCGVIEECLSSEKDRLRWGCMPRPVEPQGMPEEIADNRYAWEQYFRADEEWQEEHLVLGGGGHGHRTEECWFTYTLREGDIEPEEILANVPDGTPIISPFKVEVHYEGNYEETEPNFILWKDKRNADPS